MPTGPGDGSPGLTGPHSSRGPGHRPLKAEITGSNPVCGTNPNSGSTVAEVDAPPAATRQRLSSEAGFYASPRAAQA